MKNKEIERKFLVKTLPNLNETPYAEITQGYILDINDKYQFRLRECILFDNNISNNLIDKKYYQTIKTISKKYTIREEFEIELSHEQFLKLWTLCEYKALNKRRYFLPFNDKIVHLDVYKNAHKGLITAEVEFDSEIECDEFVPLEWFDIEITSDNNFSNIFLAKFGNPLKQNI